MKPSAGILNQRTQIGIVLAVLLWGEWLSFEWNALGWIEPEGPGVRVLIVADPQLIGYKREAFGALARWDSDRFLHRGMRVAERYAKPDVVMFLGDLFDEGVEGSNEEFSWTVDRFDAIFPRSEASRIFISGDNDIGGEGEPVYPHLIQRFSRTFPNEFRPRNTFLGMEVKEINLFEQPTKVKSLIRSGATRINILLSHSPILPTFSLKIPEIRNNTDFILSAHDHTAVRHTFNKNSGETRSREITVDRNFVTGEIGGSSNVVELQTPTCSYRMGTTKIGYGMLMLNPHLNATASYTYTVFWLPSRFDQLLLYIVTIVILVVFNLSTLCQRRRRSGFC